MRYAFAVVCLPSLILHVSCAAVIDAPPPPPPAPGPEICFAPPPEPAAPPGFVPGEGPFTADMLGRSTVLGGELLDTGAIDLFHVNAYDGFRIRRQRLYVADRVYRADSPVWCEVDARISKVDERLQDHNEIAIASFRPVDMAPITRALEASAAWAEANRSRTDVNGLKRQPDFAEVARERFANVDLNRTPYEPLKQVVGVDARRGVAEFLCGRHVLEEAKHHHAYYALVSVVYDLKAGRPLRVIVEPGGYREE